jgi:hypothetical protein
VTDGWALPVRQQLVRDEPRNPKYLYGLAHVYLNLGLLASAPGQRQARVAWFDKAIQTADDLLRAEPQHEHGKGVLQYARTHRAEALRQLGRPPDAPAK